MFQLMGNFFAGGMEAVSHGPCLFVGTSYHVADIMKMAVLEGISDPFRQNNPVYARLDKWRLTAIQVGTILAEDRSIYLAGIFDSRIAPAGLSPYFRPPTVKNFFLEEDRSA